MVIDAVSFYGKRKNENSTVDSSIAKYESLKKIKSISNPQTIIKEKKFYKQREAFSYYEDLKKRLRKESFNKEGFNKEDVNKEGSSKEIFIYTEELDNSKRCFIVDSFCSFLQFYCFYALSLDSVYFEEKQHKPKQEEKWKEKQQTIELLDWLENENSDGNENETILENKKCVKSEAVEEKFQVKTETDSNYGYKNEENRNVSNEKVHVKVEIDNKKKDKKRESMNLYELIVTEEKRWLYFDIEYECNAENGGNKETILFIFLVEFCLFVYKKFDIKLNLMDFLILDSSSEHKVSFHVIIKNIHSVPCDYFEYLVDYCHFFLNETKLSENHFYKKYKQMAQVKTEEQSTEKNYLLFDNEEVIKRFVELFINSIINKINETENIYLFKSHSICLDLHRNDSGSFDKEGFDFSKDESVSVTTPTARDSQRDVVHKKFVCDTYSNSSSSSSSSSTSVSRKSSTSGQGETNKSVKGIIGIDENNTRIKEEASERKHVDEMFKNQYFEICKHSLKDVVEYYINSLQKNLENVKKYNYIILLYAVKKRDIGNSPKRKDADEKNVTGKSLVSEEEKKEEKKIKQNSELSKMEKGMDENISDEEMKREIEWLMKDDTDFFGTYDHENETNSEERFMLQCVIDSSVYSKNRNFRLIFSTKKNKENMLLLSSINVKKYDKKKIHDVILRSLITFYKYEDVKYQIKKERIYKYKESEEVYRYHVFKIPNQGVRIYKKRVVSNDRKCKIINYENLNDSHLNTILKIIFFWNFLLYKNFKKNKKYLTTFRWEIEKEYFYKIIAIYNHFNFKKYEDYLNCYLEKSERKELDSPLKANGRLIKSEKENTDVISNYLDNFDKLFLGNKNFFQDMLKSYKKYFNLGEEEDHRIFFVRYFLYSVTFKDNEYTLFFRDNKYCRNKNFSHKSNHIYLIYNIRYNLFIQKCYDNDCKYFVSDIFQF